jgi:two-component system, NarL family, invasion response regulator UvrY
MDPGINKSGDFLALGLIVFRATLVPPYNPGEVTRMIRVAIADDHIVVREGLAELLTRSGRVTVVGEASDGDEAVRLAAQERPDVMLLDITMPGKDGIEATAEICSMDIPTRVLILTMHPDEQHAVRTLQAGASGYVWKGARFDDLVEAVVRVHAGETLIPDYLRSALGEKEREGARDIADGLSRREFQVMKRLALGMTNREIADELGVSVKTIDTHRGNVLKKLQLRNNSDITRFAVQRGFVNC